MKDNHTYTQSKPGSKPFLNKDKMRTRNLKHQHLINRQGVLHDNPPAMKVHQTILDSHQQKDQQRHHQPKKLHHQHQGDHAQSKEADPNNDDHNPRLLAPNHHPDN
jgi:hypothetical protein